MTWTWTLTKIGVGFSLGVISSNPIGWAIGIPTATLIRMKNEKNLNSSTLTFSDKVEAQRRVELATDHQIGAGLGIAFKGVGVVAKEVLSAKTLNLGRDAGKEIATHGFKTELARDLINKGQFISKIETNLKNMDKIHEVEESLKTLVNLTKDSTDNSKEEEFINNAKVIIESQNLIIDKLELLDFSDKNLLNSIKNVILELNKKNVKLYIKYEKNRDDHQLINQEINKILVRIKGIQLDLHNNDNCCDKCRFCASAKKSFCKEKGGE